MFSKIGKTIVTLSFSILLSSSLILSAHAEETAEVAAETFSIHVSDFDHVDYQYCGLEVTTECEVFRVAIEDALSTFQAAIPALNNELTLGRRAKIAAAALPIGVALGLFSMRYTKIPASFYFESFPRWIKTFALRSGVSAAAIYAFGVIANKRLLPDASMPREARDLLAKALEKGDLTLAEGDDAFEMYQALIELFAQSEHSKRQRTVILGRLHN